MKKFLLVINLVLSISTFAQFHLASFNKDATSALSKIIQDYPNHFTNIRGEVVEHDVQSTIYSCLINIDGIDSSTIIQNGDEKDNIFSWKQVVFESDDFSAAKLKFRNYYNQIKGTSVVINGSNVNFNAGYTAPDDSKPFASILFNANHEIPELKDVVIDLSMHYTITSWQISVSVYEQKDYGVDKDN